MDYLDELAERLVLAYEDEENLRDWVHFADRVGKRRALVAVLQRTLETEVTHRRLRYQDTFEAPEVGTTDEVLVTAHWM